MTLRGVLETKLLLMSSVREGKHIEGVKMHWSVVLGAAGAVEEPGAQSALQMCGNRTSSAQECGPSALHQQPVPGVLARAEMPPS